MASLQQRWARARRIALARARKLLTWIVTVGFVAAVVAAVRRLFKSSS